MVMGGLPTREGMTVVLGCDSQRTRCLRVAITRMVSR